MITPPDTIGPQLEKARLGEDPRGICTFEYLPYELQRLEDSTKYADKERRLIRGQWRGFTRPATSTEMELLRHLGYAVGDDLVTHVKWITAGVRNRSWPAIENQEIAP